MSTIDIAIIAVSGIISGFVNTVAGGGTLLTLPLLIFLGLDATVANGTNRVAILLQNVSGIIAFRQRGYFHPGYGIALGLPAVIGAVLGGMVAVRIEDQTFERVLGLVLVLSVLASTMKLGHSAEPGGKLALIGAQRWWGPLLFLAVGFYGGFIQAGVGFLILAVLSGMLRLDLVNANAIKVFVVFLYTIAALVIFLAHGQIDWPVGLWLSAGMVAGGWMGAHWSVGKGSIWIRRLLIATVIAFAIKLALG